MDRTVMTELFFKMLVFLLLSQESKVSDEYRSDGGGTLHTCELKKEENDVSDCAVFEEPVAPVIGAINAFVVDQGRRHTDTEDRQNNKLSKILSQLLRLGSKS